MSRKRTRSQAFADEHDDRPALQLHPEVEETEEEKQAKREKIWDSVKEEYFEVVDQLPVSLERYFHLIRRLDEQSAGFSSQILPTLQSYIALRRSLASQSNTRSTVQVETSGDNAEADSIPLPNGSHAHSEPSTSLDEPHTNGHPDIKVERISQSPSKSSTPAMLDRASSTFSKPEISPQPHIQNSTRALIAKVAHLAEENVRASEEKVNLAQAAYDSIDRQIRMLDQAIKEQETSISLGLRPGTHPTSIVLPDVASAYKRSSRISTAARDDLHVGMTLGMPSTGSHAPAPKGRKKNKKKVAGVEMSAAPEEPPLSITIAAPQQLIDPDEPRYCFCNQVSFGDMIGCDNPDCAREWFHYGCVGIKAPPDGGWYCEECKENMRRTHRKKGGRAR